MLRKILRRVGRGERGQDYVEFAVIAPILLLLVLGIGDFGRVFNSYLLITGGAREGARYAAVGRSEADVVSRVEETTSGLAVAVTVDPADPGDRTPNEPVTVTVSADVQVLSAPILLLLRTAGVIEEDDDSFHLVSSAQMRYEGPWI